MPGFVLSTKLPIWQVCGRCPGDPGYVTAIPAAFWIERVHTTLDRAQPVVDHEKTHFLGPMPVSSVYRPVSHHPGL